MTGIIIALLLSLLAVEYFFHFPIVREGRRLLSVINKSIWILRSKHISDHWKERVLIRYALDILKSTLHFALLFVGFLLILGAGGLFIDRMFAPEPTTIETLTSPIGWVWMTTFASAYIYSKNRVIAASEKSGYTYSDRLLHYLALGLPWIGRILYDADQVLTGNVDRKEFHHPVFISGLARAGTTILMKIFYETGMFRSLTYRDMPFVLMPGIWKRISKPFYRYENEKERAHGDGIMVNFDSPEAFEEVFWRVFSADDYIYKDRLTPSSPNEGVIRQFRQFVGQVISSAEKPDQGRYLSKNNNNILRLGSIRRAFPNSLIIVPFRDPVQHSISLFLMHKKFCEAHEKDFFSRNYMKWLGHHEFGVTHRPFQFGDSHAVTAKNHQPTNINYWLALWINTYRYLLETAPSGTVFVCFEMLCNHPKQTIDSIFSKANLPINDYYFDRKIKIPQLRQNIDIDYDLSKQASIIYADLSKRVK